MDAPRASGRRRGVVNGRTVGHRPATPHMYIVKWHDLTLLNSLVHPRPSNRLDRRGQNLNIHSDTIPSYKAGFRSVPNA